MQRQSLNILGRTFLVIFNVCINYYTNVMDISFGTRTICLDVFKVSMRSIGNTCICFSQFDDEDKADLDNVPASYYLTF